MSRKEELTETDTEQVPEKFKNLFNSVKDAKDESNSFVDTLFGRIIRRWPLQSIPFPQVSQSQLCAVKKTRCLKLTASFYKHSKSRKTNLEALQSVRGYIGKAGYNHRLFWDAFIWLGWELN